MNLKRKILALTLAIIAFVNVTTSRTEVIKAEDSNLGIRYSEQDQEKLDKLFEVEVRNIELEESRQNLVEDEYVFNGPKLTKSKGVNQGPSGRETYYNLPMNGVINTMRRMGNNDKYWVRDDGVKMLGKYVMIAANLNIRPRGSLVPTSLGMGIVCDTGGFASKNPTQIDIATSW